VLRLITIPISHYCEKARWALERAGLPYREDCHVQGIHRIVARRAGGGTTVPVLVTPDGVLGESEEILAWTDQQTTPEQRLFPADREERDHVLRLCRRFDQELGPRGRRLIYVHMLGQRDLVLRFNNQGVPGWEAGVIRYGWPAVKPFMNWALDISPGIEVEDERVVWEEFDFAAEALASAGPYLGGERFGAADLTFAALSAAVIAPPGYGVELPRPDVMAPATADLITRAREHPAGAYAMKLFAEHRHERVPAALTPGG
jgi:glutathione S-transferase